MTDHIDAQPCINCARYRDALRHYADDEMWGIPPVLPDDTHRDWYLGPDNGWEVARAVLAGATITVLRYDEEQGIFVREPSEGVQ